MMATLDTFYQSLHAKRMTSVTFRIFVNMCNDTFSIALPFVGSPCRVPAFDLIWKNAVQTNAFCRCNMLRTRVADVQGQNQNELHSLHHRHPLEREINPGDKVRDVCT